MKIYIGVGHGQKPNYAAALRNAGWEVVEERHSGPGHDPDWHGSAKNANNENVNYADEVHFNAGGGTGTEVLVHPNTSQRNRRFAELACQYVSGALGLRNRGVKPRPNLGFLNATSMPTTIPEIAFVDNDTDRAVLRSGGWAEKVGQALARARIEAG